MIEILSSTALATIQDLGRENYLRFGVGTAGAMDRVALEVGNTLLGNAPGAAGIEIPLFPFRVRFLEDIDFALTGADCGARLDRTPVPPWWRRRARAGQTLLLGAPARGARCYLTLAGGVDVPVVLGSRSTQLRGEFGGHLGRTLQKGDVIRAVRCRGSDDQPADSDSSEFGAEPAELAIPLGDRITARDDVTAVRVLPAGEYRCYTDTSLEAFWTEEWKITPQSDRYGYRLAGSALVPIEVIEKRSHGIVPGVIQVPHSGQPIIQLRDAQPSGGYPKIGTVIEADLWRVGQARPGTKLRFVEASYEEAVSALDAVEAYVDKVRQFAGLYLISKR